MGIYHAPPNEFNNHTAFVDSFVKLIGDLRVKHKNLIIAGDFNIHVNNSEDLQANDFLDTIESLGLKNFVLSPTHVKGNTLDLIIGDEISTIKPTFIKLEPYFSDHCIVSAVFNIQKDRMPIKEITFETIKIRTLIC